MSQPPPPQDYVISITGAAGREVDRGLLTVVVNTNRGDIQGMLSPAREQDGGVVWVAGASGGFLGPARNLYGRLSRELQAKGVTSLRLHYRFPNVFEESVLDVLAGINFLRGIGVQRVCLVGHSFGGGVVVKAGILGQQVVGVAALSSQLFGTHEVEKLSPRELLIVHGERDSRLGPEAARIIYDQARAPKQLILLEDAGHGLEEAAEELRGLLSEWLLARVGPKDSSAGEARGPSD